MARALCPCRLVAGRGWPWAPCLPREGAGWVGSPARRQAPSGPTGPVRRPCRTPGRSTSQAPGVSRVAHTARGTPVRRWPKPPWSWWGAQTSLRRGVVLLPGCGAHRAIPRACAQAQGRKADRRGATPRAQCRAHTAPNNALEPTAPMVACTHSASLVARRLTAGVGLLCAALLPGVARGKSRPGMTAPGPMPGVPVVSIATPACPMPNGRRGPRRWACCPLSRPGGPCTRAGGA